MSFINGTFSEVSDNLGCVGMDKTVKNYFLGLADNVIDCPTGMLPNKTMGKSDQCIDDPVLDLLDCGSAENGGRRTAVKYGANMGL